MYLICHTSIRAHHNNSIVNCLTIEHCNGFLNCKYVPKSPKKINGGTIRKDFIELKKTGHHSKTIKSSKNHTKCLCVMNFT